MPMQGVVVQGKEKKGAANRDDSAVALPTIEAAAAAEQARVTAEEQEVPFFAYPHSFRIFSFVHIHDCWIGMCLFGCCGLLLLIWLLWTIVDLVIDWVYGYNLH